MTSLPSSSESRLDERVRRWIFEQGWTSLREIQSRAIGPVLDGKCDVIIAAATAGGKTEAAFLPICSALVAAPPQDLHGVRALYVSPLKALINDQFDRLERLCGALEIPVHRWHGDVAAGHKRELLEDPAGVLLITPESLEALFVLRGSALPGLFAALEFIVVDELHAFIGTERGKQLQSLLARLELVVRRRIPRIALSATLGDMRMAADFLRPSRQLPCEIITPADAAESAREVRLQVRGYRGEALADIGAHLFQVLRGKDNLIFANSRRNVEIYGDYLRQLSEQARVPNEFFPHHGSLARDLREHAEAMLKDPAVPASVVCTTTLEMGIDIGSVSSIAQIGPPPSVAALRQRLGRSGRRGEPATLRVYVEESLIAAADGDAAPQDRLHAALVQAIAMVQLLLAKWCEPPEPVALHLSTLVQQVLSLIAQNTGARADEMWRALCHEGAFPAVDERIFAMLLRELGRRDILTQSADGTLLPGVAGEKLLNHYSFYTAFVTPDEYRLVANGSDLGSLPIAHPLAKGGTLIFAGQRWKILAVDADAKVVQLAPTPAGRAPKFEGTSALVHERVRQQMKAVYESTEVPAFLDATARELLKEGREAYAALALARAALISNPGNGDVVAFAWCGDRTLDTLLVQLQARGLEVERDGLALTVSHTTVDTLTSHLRALADAGSPADPIALAAAIPNKIVEKYHPLLSEVLLAMDYASDRLDVAGARRVAQELTLRRG
jgi:ATP-dependent Lhr-like helicase